MWTPSPAIEWLESHPESPCNLRHAQIVSRHHMPTSYFWEEPHVLWRAFPPLNQVRRQPMFALKRDG